MKKLLPLFCLALLLIGLTGCGDGITSLTIANSSSVYMQDVEWLSYDFGAMYAGSSKTLEVIPATDYVYLCINGYWYYTEQSATVSEGRRTTFTLRNETIVYSLSSATAQSTDIRPVQLKDLMADPK